MDASDDWVGTEQLMLALWPGSAREAGSASYRERLGALPAERVRAALRALAGDGHGLPAPGVVEARVRVTPGPDDVGAGTLLPADVLGGLQDWIRLRRTTVAPGDPR